MGGGEREVCLSPYCDEGGGSGRCACHSIVMSEGRCACHRTVMGGGKGGVVPASM